MKKHIYLVLISMFIFGCFQEESINIQINNYSSHEINSVWWYAYSGNYIYSDSIEINTIIPVNDSITFKWVNPILFKMDGAFQVKVGELSKSIGYFSNGHIIPGGIYDDYTLYIYDDSLKFK
ncbi:MAG: hypothetical protein WCT23_06505 [Candidatus Neomarinimicrobiota bacterium]